ncbi:hypothetical protein [Prevotella fusca]|nr:hypothetical protein [Prevotella fusca]
MRRRYPLHSQLVRALRSGFLLFFRPTAVLYPSDMQAYAVQL